MTIENSILGGIEDMRSSLEAWIASATGQPIMHEQRTPYHTAMMIGTALMLIIGVLLVLRVAKGVILEMMRWVNVALKTRHVPMAPGCHWLLGHVGTLASGCAWEYMYKWVTDCPPLVKFRVLHRTGVIVGDPRGVKRIFQTRYKAYDKDLDFSYGPFLPILGTGLVTANGQHWQKQRILMAPALRIDMLDAIIPIARRAAGRLAVKLEALRGTQQAIDIEEEFRLLTLQVIGEAILSLAPEDCDRVFPSLYLPVMEESNKRVLAPWRYLYPVEAFKYNARVHKLNSCIKGIIRERRAARAKVENPPQNDILDKILESVEKDGVKWDAKAETQLCYEIKTFLLAGHETSAAMLTWTVFELAKNSKALEKIRQESKGAGLVSSSSVPKRETVEEMEWTLACLKESLRKYSVVPVVTRNMNADDELCGYKMPRGSWIICHLQRIHHLYKDPLRWNPQRFMPGDEYDQFEDDIRPYMFLPFIQGPRNCLGQYFALIEARVVLGSLCEQFKFNLVDPENQGVTHPTVIPIGPVGGLKVFVE